MTAPWARPQPAPVPGPSGPPSGRPAPRRHLRVVRPVDPAVMARRRARLVTTVLATVAIVGLFAIVGLRVVLAQGQAEVDRLAAQVEQVQADQQRLRLLVAERESPRVIVAAARDRLGMVPVGPKAHLRAVPAAPR
jgi:cell division protein FtsB